MKNKQINKFLFIFVVGLSLLFSFSSAEMVANVDYPYNESTYTSTVLDLTIEDTAVLDNYLSNMTYYEKDIEAFGASWCSKLGFSNFALGTSHSTSPAALYFLFFDEPDDLVFNITNSIVYKPCIFPDKTVIQLYYKKQFSEYTFKEFKNTSSTDIFFNTAYLNSFYNIKASCDFKKLSWRNSMYYWNGYNIIPAYFDPPVITPEVATPEFVTDLTDDEIASVVDNFINSMNWKNRESLYDYFFISYDENEGKYLLVLTSEYMYKLLSGLYIPAGVSSVDYEAMEYDTYSILYNNGVTGTFLPWQTNRFNYKLFTSLDGVNFDYLTDMDCKDFNKYRWTMDAPVIYSNFYLPFKTLLGNTTNVSGSIINDYSEEVDLKFSELVDSETGENHVFEGLDVKSNEETNPIIAKLSQFFKEMLEGFSGLFQVLIDQIFNFSDFLLETYGENVVTLVFAILIKSVTVLVSSIALIFRAVGFILSLVSIPASSALFSVDVAVNSTGLTFTGLNWGAKFVEGLNMLKSFSWNGLGLWTLFESFVSALEVILFVKIVKKHYSHTL